MTHDIRDLHRYMGIETSPVFGSDGRRRADAFLVAGVFVRVAGFWRAVWALLTGRHSGVLIRHRGTARDGGPESPVYILDHETYSRMLLGLQAQRLPDVGMTGDPADLASAEHEAERVGAF